MSKTLIVAEKPSVARDIARSKRGDRFPVSFKLANESENLSP